MPLYDLVCPNCDKVDSDVLLRSPSESHICSRCSTVMRRIFPTSVNVHIWPSDGVFLEHVSNKGKTFYSKKEMKEYAKKHNMEIAMLED